MRGKGYNGRAILSLAVQTMANWWEQLDKKRGSRPRCVLLTDGRRAEVAARLTNLVAVPELVISAADRWLPYGKPVLRENGQWDKTPAREAQLGKANTLVSGGINQQLLDWWLTVQTKNITTPSWDIASTCHINGQPGLLLVEAKAHAAELDAAGKYFSEKSNRQNHEKIGLAIEQANAALTAATGNPWHLSRDHHYQLSNRFAWAWRLADLGVPVVLLYLGFLNAQEMDGKDTELFQSAEQWAAAVQEYGAGVVDNACWGQMLNMDGTPLLPLLRVYDQPFYP